MAVTMAVTLCDRDTTCRYVARNVDVVTFYDDGAQEVPGPLNGGPSRQSLPRLHTRSECIVLLLCRGV